MKSNLANTHHDTILVMKVLQINNIEVFGILYFSYP